MTQKISREERRQKLKERTQENIKNRNSGNNGKGVFNFSDCGDGDVKFFKPDKKRHTIDILPYIIKSDNHPDKEMKVGYEDYLLDYHVHFKIGSSEESFLCLKRTYGKPCPICEEIQILRKEKADDDIIKSLNPKHRCLYNIIDLDDQNKGVQLFDASFHLFEKELREELNELEDDEMVFPFDYEQGKSIKFRTTEESFSGMKYIKFKNFSFEERDSYEESILKETFPLDAMLNIPTYEQVKNAYLGIDEDDNDDEEKEEKTIERKSKSVNEPNEKVCPHDHKFCDDCDKYKECMECKLFDDCADAHDGKK